MKMHVYVTDVQLFLDGNYGFSLHLSDRSDIGGGSWTYLQEVDIDLDESAAANIREIAKNQIAEKISASKSKYEHDMAELAEQANKIADAEQKYTTL